ncbi:MAG: argininosuccinate lyase [Planctomycetota bacterium]
MTSHESRAPEGSPPVSGAPGSADAPSSPDAPRAPEALWGGRFEGALDPLFERVNQSLPFDRRLLPEDVRGSQAWARALGAAGVLEEAEVEQLVAALDDVLAAAVRDPERVLASGAEDVHSYVEAELVDRVGDLGRRLHTGRSRNDQVATDLKLHLRDRLGALVLGVRSLQAALAELAVRHAADPLPGYTHLQRAQPVTFGHQCLAYVEMLDRDAGRFEDAAARMDRCPLGSGALAGVPYAIDRHALSVDLGFGGGPTRNSLDAVSDRDHALETTSACATTMVHLSRLAEDWVFLASSEARMLRFGDRVSTGSSLMPQKRNPDALELVRGKVGRVHGAHVALVTTMKGLPLAYDKDMQEDKEPLFDALDQTLDALAVARACALDVTFDTGAGRAAASGDGFLEATDLADLLVARGVPFRTAHERVGRAVERAIARGTSLGALPADDRAELVPELDGVDLETELGVDAVLARRVAYGGTAPDRVAEEAERWKRAL